MGNAKLPLSNVCLSPPVPPSPPSTPPPPPPRYLMLQGDIFMYSNRSALCTLLKEGLYVYL